MSKKVVIIGGVATGMKTAARLRRLDKDAKIIVLERGQSLSYGACGFPYYISGEVKSFNSFDHTPQGILRDSEYFRTVKGVDARTGCNVTKIDRASKTVTYETQEGEQVLAYDKLVLGTGATPVKLPLPGADAQGIHSFWFPWDVHAVEDEINARKVTDVVIIGAGFIGMELAENFAKRGLKTSVVEMQDRVLPQLLDKEIADLLLPTIKKNNIKLCLNEKTVAFEVTNGIVSGVKTDKQVIPAQLVIVAVGVRPNVELAKACGLAIGPTGCIAVNEYMETSDPDIYAGGDCAENTHIISKAKVFTPMGSTANKHGRVIAGNICGQAIKYPGVLGTGICQIFDMEAGSTGLNERTAKLAGIEYKAIVTPGNDRLNYMPGVGRIVVKMLVEVGSQRIIGVQAIGKNVSKRIDTMVTAMSFGATLQQVANLDIAYAPPFNGPIDNLGTAANCLGNKLAGRFNGINPKDFEAMRAQGGYLFLDVRTAPEVSRNRIAGIPNFVNIPLGELRQRLDELGDKDQFIITSCQIDLRGYEAETILRQAGFTNAHSLEGGMSGWPYATEHD
ncbi:MAG: FAD-dependent oxidoreductase [Phascolarctobacterium sp.]|nr:FAD-dependent oxidoreductase [Phascolarctobacterium sp.]